MAPLHAALLLCSLFPAASVRRSVETRNARNGTDAKLYLGEVEDEVTAQAVGFLAGFDFNKRIDTQLFEGGVVLGLTAVSAFNPILGAVLGTFFGLIRPGGKDTSQKLVEAILKQVDTLVKDSLASFANDLKDAHLSGTLDLIEYARTEEDWNYIANDFRRYAPFIFNESCWNENGDPSDRNYKRCYDYQYRPDFRSVKYETQYAALVASSITEMLRIAEAKTNRGEKTRLYCKVADLQSLVAKIDDKSRGHVVRYTRRRNNTNMITNPFDSKDKSIFYETPSCPDRKRKGCTARNHRVEDKFLKKTVGSDFYHGCIDYKKCKYETTSSRTRRRRSTRRRQCDFENQMARPCREKYKTQIFKQLEQVNDQKDDFRFFRQHLDKVASKFRKRCGS